MLVLRSPIRSTAPRSGRRAFVVDERGDVRAWDAEGRFSGDDQPVPATAAYGADATRWTATR